MKEAILELLELTIGFFDAVRAALRWFEPFGIALTALGILIAGYQYFEDREVRRAEHLMRETTLFVMTLERLEAVRNRDSKAEKLRAHQGPVMLLERLHMGGASLVRIDASDVDLTGVQLPAAQLGGAAFDGSSLDYANLSGADISSASARRASFVAADLRGANFFDSDLSGANFRHAALEEAEFAAADISNAQFDFTFLHTEKPNFRFANFFEGRPPIGLTEADFQDMYVCNDLQVGRVTGCRPFGAKPLKLAPEQPSHDHSESFFDLVPPDQ